MRRAVPFLAAAMLVAAATAHAGEANPLQLFRKVPVPPKSITAAVSSVRITADSQPTAHTPAYDALLDELKAQVEVGGTAAGQQQVNQAGLGVDVERMRTDPAYAQQMQAKMAGMSMSDKMAMAQRWMAAQNGSGQSMAQMQAHGRVLEYMGQAEQANVRTLGEINQMFRQVLDEETARHDAVDREINAAVEKCPDDQTGLAKVWSCANPLEKRALREHRAAELKSLAEEGAVYRKAWRLAKARVDAISPMLTVARRGGSLSDVATISNEISKYTELLAEYGRAVTERAAFWGEPGLTADFINVVTLRCSVKAGADQEVTWLHNKYW